MRPGCDTHALAAGAVTVVIPTRNRRDRLERTLASALAQDAAELTVVVVDDGSSDATEAMLRSHEDARVHCVVHPRSLGVAAARNRGIAEATTEWIALLDDDDLWSPAKLCTQLAVARDAHADFVYCSAVHLDHDLHVLQVEPAPDAGALATLLHSYNAIPAGSSNVLVRRAVLGELGGYDESFTHLADWDLWLRLTGHGAAGAACPEPLVGYVKHPENMVSLDSRELFTELDRLEAKHWPHARAGGPRPDRVAVARWVADTHRRSGRRMRAARAYLRAFRFGDLRGLTSLLRTLTELDPNVRPWFAGPVREPEWLADLREPQPTAR